LFLFIGVCLGWLWVQFVSREFDENTAEWQALLHAKSVPDNISFANMSHKIGRCCLRGQNESGGAPWRPPAPPEHRPTLLVLLKPGPEVVPNFVGEIWQVRQEQRVRLRLIRPTTSFGFPHV
jgi:hypothetical protein